MEMGEDCNKDSIIEFCVRKKHAIRLMIDLDKCQTSEDAKKKIRNMLVNIDNYIDAHFGHLKVSKQEKHLQTNSEPADGTDEAP